MKPPRSALFLTALLAACAHAPVPTGTDCHMHVTPEPESEFFPQDAARAASALEGAGLKRGCILSPGYTQHDCKDADCQRAWTRKANDWTIAEAKKNQDLLAFCGIPMEQPWAADEVRRCAKEGARGLKLHPVAQGLSLTDHAAYESLDQIAKAAGENKLPILIHIPFTDEDADAFFRLAAGRPEENFLLAHQLGPKIASVVRAPKNVYIDISGLVLAPRKAAPMFVSVWRKVGMDRIVLGSDWPNLHPSEYTAALRAFPLTADERRLIVTDNARRLFPEK